LLDFIRLNIHEITFLNRITLSNSFFKSFLIPFLIPILGSQCSLNSLKDEYLSLYISQKDQNNKGLLLLQRSNDSLFRVVVLL